MDDRQLPSRWHVWSHALHNLHCRIIALLYSCAFVHLSKLAQTIKTAAFCFTQNTVLCIATKTPLYLVDTMCTVYTYEGWGHCLLKFSNSTGFIKVIKWTILHGSQKLFLDGSGNHKRLWPNLVYFLMSDKARVSKRAQKPFNSERGFFCGYLCKCFVEQKHTRIHKISFSVTKFWLFSTPTVNALTCPGKPKWSALGAV